MIGDLPPSILTCRDSIYYICICLTLQGTYLNTELYDTLDTDAIGITIDHQVLRYMIRPRFLSIIHVHIRYRSASWGNYELDDRG